MTLAYRAHALCDRLVALRSVLRLRENTAPETQHPRGAPAFTSALSDVYVMCREPEASVRTRAVIDLRSHAARANASALLPPALSARSSSTERTACRSHVLRSRIQVRMIRRSCSTNAERPEEHPLDASPGRLDRAVLWSAPRTRASTCESCRWPALATAGCVRATSCTCRQSLST